MIVIIDIMNLCHEVHISFPFRYRTLGHTASQSRISTFFLLLDLMQFFDLYHAGQLDTALDVSLTGTPICMVL